MVNQNKVLSFKIKRQTKNVFPSDVEWTVTEKSVYFTARYIRKISFTSKICCGYTVEISRENVLMNTRNVFS